MKKLFAVLTLIFAIGALGACGDDDLNTRDAGNDGTMENGESDEESLDEFTLEELSQYDGKDGRDAYVAVDGEVYDVTESSYWSDGIHQGRIEAGQDLTQEIDDSPHGRSTLDRVPKIGILVDSESSD